MQGAKKLITLVHRVEAARAAFLVARDNYNPIQLVSNAHEQARQPQVEDQSTLSPEAAEELARCRNYFACESEYQNSLTAIRRYIRVLAAFDVLYLAYEGLAYDDREQLNQVVRLADCEKLLDFDRLHFDNFPALAFAWNIAYDKEKAVRELIAVHNSPENFDESLRSRAPQGFRRRGYMRAVRAFRMTNQMLAEQFSDVEERQSQALHTVEERARLVTSRLSEELDRFVRPRVQSEALLKDLLVSILPIFVEPADDEFGFDDSESFGANIRPDVQSGETAEQFQLRLREAQAVYDGILGFVRDNYPRVKRRADPDWQALSTQVLDKLQGKPENRRGVNSAPGQQEDDDEPVDDLAEEVDAEIEPTPDELEKLDEELADGGDLTPEEQAEQERFLKNLEDNMQ